MPWQKNYNKTEVLNNAVKAFWLHGYESTSMNDLVEATGINRGSIYSAFPNKHALFMSALHHYDQIYRAAHLERISAEYSPRDAIITVFETAATKPTEKNIPWGCLLVNTALELSPHDAEVREFVDQSLQGVENFFFSRIEAAKRDGTVRESIDSRSTAQALLSLFLGLRVLTSSKTRQSTIEATTSQARMMLE
jgi:TetR/AcrR family transcriptional repressor of nem operon